MVFLVLTPGFGGRLRFQLIAALTSEGLAMGGNHAHETGDRGKTAKSIRTAAALVDRREGRP
jgi:hypothetical protein